MSKTEKGNGTTFTNMYHVPPHDKSVSQIQHVPIILKNDRDFILQSVKNDGKQIKYASEEMKNDPEIVMEACRNFRGAIEFASEELRNDKDFIREVVQIEISGQTEYHPFLYFANEKLKDDDDIVRFASYVDNDALGCASVRLRNDKVFILSLVKKDGSLLKYAGDILKNDRTIIEEACSNHRMAFQFVGEDLTVKSELLRIARSNGGDVEGAFETVRFKGSTERIEADPFEDFMKRLLTTSNEQFFVPFSDKPIIIKKKVITEVGIWRDRIVLMEKKFRDLDILKLLGHGSYGYAYLCRIRGVKGLFVAKIFNDVGLTTVEERIGDNKKRESLMLPFHLNIAPILCHQTGECIDLSKLPDYGERWKNESRSSIYQNCEFVLMKYHRIDLQKYKKEYLDDKIRNTKNEELGSNNNIILKQIITMIFGLIEGVCYLHDNFIVHRDIHEANIFVDPRFGRIWIGDFGCHLDLRLNPTKFLVSKNDEIMYSIRSSLSSNGVFRNGGWYRCIAPEIRDFKPEGDDDYLDYEKCDIYSIGFVGKRLLGGRFKSSVICDLIEKMMLPRDKDIRKDRLGCKNAREEFLQNFDFLSGNNYVGEEKHEKVGPVTRDMIEKMMNTRFQPVKDGVDENGRTMLFHAVVRNDVNTVKRLVSSRNVDLGKLDNYGWNVFTFCEALDLKHVPQYLLRLKCSSCENDILVDLARGTITHKCRGRSQKVNLSNKLLTEFKLKHKVIQRFQKKDSEEEEEEGEEEMLRDREYHRVDFSVFSGKVNCCTVKNCKCLVLGGYSILKKRKITFIPKLE